MYILLDIDNVILKNSYYDEKGNIQYFCTLYIEKDLGIKQSTLRFLFDDRWIDVLLGRILLNNKVSDFFNNIQCSFMFFVIIRLVKYDYPVSVVITVVSCQSSRVIAYNGMVF